MSVSTGEWLEINQDFLSREMARIRTALERVAAQDPGSREPAVEEDRSDASPGDDSDSSLFPGTRPALEQLQEGFGLSSFERDVITLCAGVELDSSIAALCSTLHGDPARSYPTFSLALSCLAGAHWSALNPAAPLRHWRMIELGAGHALTQSPLRIDERVLHFLTGVHHLDERVRAIVEPISAAEFLTPTHQRVAERIAAAWERTSGWARPAIHLRGTDTLVAESIAAAVCSANGLNLHRMPAESLPASPSDLETLARLLEREAILGGSALMLACDDVEMSDTGRVTSISRFLGRMRAPLIVASRTPLADWSRSTIALDVPRPGTAEQRALLNSALGDGAQRLNGHVERLISQFDLDSPSIQAAGAFVRANLDRVPDDDLGQQLWDTVRDQSRPRLDDLAQRIEPAASWDDLVLPDAQRQILHDVAVHVRQRSTVYDSWGFASRGNRGLGISALFSGSSGTGKTMAAEVLANDLRLDLYRIDLSSVVSKYIGETEKNLRRVFDAAEGGGAILLFDEADALFGKRSEVKDSHDRYANIEVSYLLQRMEAYRGLAILTTNLRSALDPAFLRRIRFIVQFPFPDADQRAQIWERIFPDATPTKDLDMVKLSRLNVAGGTIRNIALNAAFLAADADEPVGMPHLLRAARAEYAKLEKSLTEAESGGWT